MLKLLSLALLLCFATVASASATSFQVPPDGSYLYRLTHSSHGELGTHRITIDSDDDQRKVTVERKLQVRVLLVTAYREKTRTQELWRDGQMVSFTRRSEDGDKVSTLTVTEQGDALTGEGPKGAVSLPLGTFTTNPWNPAIVDQTQLMDTTDGHAVKVSFSRVGEETLTVLGRPLAATRYEMTGDETRTLWYDAQGRLVQQVIHKDGDTITFTLESYGS